jgi:hypothetical protein
MIDATDDAAPAHVTLTTDRITSDGADALAAALHVAGVVVERRTFLPTREDVAHPWGVLLLAGDGPPSPLVELVAPATAPAGVFPTLAATLGFGHPLTPATLQLKANGVFISVRARDTLDITSALTELSAHLARLHPGSSRSTERRLVYGEGTWRIDP